VDVFPADVPRPLLDELIQSVEGVSLEKAGNVPAARVQGLDDLATEGGRRLGTSGNIAQIKRRRRLSVGITHNESLNLGHFPLLADGGIKPAFTNGPSWSA